MNKIIQTTKSVIPMIYAYTHPTITEHKGYTKIGYTEQDVEKRIREQNRTANIPYVIEWNESAIYSGTSEIFKDYDFHKYLEKLNFERLLDEKEKTKTEWFCIEPNEARYKLIDFRNNHGMLYSDSVFDYELRSEQNDAVFQTKEYFENHQNSEFLWNAKPRFGKTLTAYELCKKLDAYKVLIITNRPAIVNSWYSDYEKFLGTESGYYFISTNDNLKGKKLVYENFDSIRMEKRIEFVSLQDLKGSIYFGGSYNKLEEVANLEWDLLIIDEAHEGIDTYRTEEAFDKIKRKYTLHLSGTPFKALANYKFESDAIFNWTYVDEQNKKSNWNNEDGANPYDALPKLNLLTFKMSDIVLDKVRKGCDFNEDGNNEAYAFDLNEFFKTNDKGVFIHNEDVDKFLDALTTQKKFPFSEEYREELSHTLWILKYVNSAKALAKKLETHPVFKDYKIILAAGDGKLDEEDFIIERETKKAYNQVVKAIKESKKTITLSVGQLTTGITIPEWTAVMILSNMNSPALYMQAAFRTQNPCLFKIGSEFKRKENCYVFDFDPARSLEIIEQFANGLSESTIKGDVETQKDKVKELLNFLPVYSEDENGEMIELNAEQVLLIPRQIHSQEVVKSGFRNNYLFQNISGIFSAPLEVIDIINNMQSNLKEEVNISPKTKNDLNINEDGEIEIPKEIIVGTSNKVFGDKLYKIEETVKEKFDNFSNKTDLEQNEVLKDIEKEILDKLIDIASSEYKKDFSQSVKKIVTKEIQEDVKKITESSKKDFLDKINKREEDRKIDIQNATSEEEIELLNEIYDEQKETDEILFVKNLNEEINKVTKESTEKIVEKIEIQKKDKEKKTLEEKVRSHLRGFSRTIPSFLMAYGNENTTLANFEKDIPENVFKEVTSISIEDFKFLRDGGTYIDKETGEEKSFKGKLFDSVVFNDSIKLFLKKRKELANYFDEDTKEDIFDYIPNQQTNQIFTPKNVVKRMVDYLEKENPGCFDNPESTFIDLYMKSGLYITEIVKRLFRSEEIKKIYPDDKKRLQHIFEKQIYGLAPTEIIYKIAIRYILGFSEDNNMIEKHNLIQQDALKYIQENTLSEKLDEWFS